MFKKILAFKVFDGFRGLSSHAKQAILLSCVYFFAISIGEIFVNIFIWRVSASIKTVATYNFFEHSALLLGYLIVGPFFKKRSVSYLYRISFFLLFLFYINIFWLREKAVDYILLIGLLKGLGGGFYWSAHNTMVFLGTKDKVRDLFVGLLGSFISIITTIAPLIAGFLIWSGPKILGGELTGYYILFGILGLVFLGSEFVIKKTTDVSFEIYRFSEVLKLPFKDSTWRIQFINSILRGFMLVSVMLYSVFSIVVLKDELFVGFLVGVISFSAALSSSFFGSIYRPGRRIVLGAVGAVVGMMGDIILAWQLNPVGFLVGRFLREVIGYPLVAITFLSVFYLTIERNPEGKKRIFEFLTSNDIGLAIGRLSSIIVFIVFLDFYSQINASRIWYIIVSGLYLATWLFTRKVHKRLIAEGYKI